MNERSASMSVWHGTTIMSVRKNGKVVVAGDGQVASGAEAFVHHGDAETGRDLDTVVRGQGGATAQGQRQTNYSGEIHRAHVRVLGILGWWPSTPPWRPVETRG